MQVSPDTWYCGSPEADGFKHDMAAGALMVTFDGPAGVGAQVDVVQTGTLHWRMLQLDLLPGDDPVARLEAELPAAHLRRDLLLRLQVSGRLPLADRSRAGGRGLGHRPRFRLVRP